MLYFHNLFVAKDWWNHTLIIYLVQLSHMWPDLQEGVLYAHHFNTQISPPFYRYIIRQSMGACIVANSSPVCFSWGCFWGMSDVHECSVCIQLSLLAVKQRPPSCKVSHDLVVILSTDLTTFWANSGTSGSIIQVWIHSVCFPRHFVAPHHPQPTTPM